MDPITLALVGSTIFKAGSSILGGKSARKAASSQARQVEWNAQRSREAGATRAQEESRRTARLMSDAQAIQAASGFSGSDPTALKQLADIAGAGKYNELALRYDSEMQAQGLQREARNMRKTGRRTQRAAYLDAGTTLFSGATDIGFFDAPPTSTDVGTVGPLRSGYVRPGGY